MRRPLIILFSLVILALGAGMAQAYCTTTNVTVVNTYNQQNAVMYLTLESDPDFHRAVGVPAGHIGAIEVCDTAWFMKETTYNYTAAVHWEGQEEPACVTVFTVKNTHSLYPEILSCTVVSSTCSAEATVYSIEGYVTIQP